MVYLAHTCTFIFKRAPSCTSIFKRIFVLRTSDGSNIVWPEYTDAGVNSEKWVEKRAKSPARGKAKVCVKRENETRPGYAKKAYLADWE